MARRHEFRPGDWVSAAVRVDEIISAHSGEDSFEEALKLLVAKLAHESSDAADSPFLLPQPQTSAAHQVNRLLAAAGERWRGILDPGAEIRLSGPEITRCAAVLGELRLLADDLVGLDSIFEFMVNKAAKGQKGQYFTPRHVIAEVVKMVRPTAGERVLDPACGSGGFLCHALRHEPACSTWGFDQDSRAVRVARVMMAASGQPAARVQRGDSLRRPACRAATQTAPLIEELMREQEPAFPGFDVILTNPPFAGDVGTEYSGCYELARRRRVERDVLFVERCVELLRPGGRLAMILPYNKVGGASWAYLRIWLLLQVRVVAVLGLGRNTFQPHTGQKACVVIGIRRPQSMPQHLDEDILFFISEKEGKDPRGRLSYAADGRTVTHDLSEATPLVRRRFNDLTQDA